MIGIFILYFVSVVAIDQQPTVQCVNQKYVEDVWNVLVRNFEPFAYLTGENGTESVSKRQGVEIIFVDSIARKLDSHVNYVLQTGFDLRSNQLYNDK